MTLRLSCDSLAEHSMKLKDENCRMREMACELPFVLVRTHQQLF